MILSRRQIATHGRLWSTLSVVLATVGCAPPGPKTPAASLEPLRHLARPAQPSAPALSYLRAGTPDGPRLILLHGTPGSANGWADYLSDPPAGLDVIAIDRPGFGASGPDGAVTSLLDQAAAVGTLLPDDGRPVVLLGHSLGGPIVAQAAALYPGRISAIILLAGSLDPAQEAIHPMQYVGAWSLVKGMLPRAIRNANAELMALKPELEALGLLLPQITTKVLIVHGTKDDLVPVANVPYMQAKFTGARCVKTVLLEGRNHFLPWNSADVVRDAIRQALEPGC